MRIAIQGVAGSFHHEAATKLFQSDDYELVPCTDFADVFSAVANGEADKGLVAVENNIYGSINDVHRLLDSYHIWILSEVRLQIRMQLIGCKETSLEELADAGSAIHVLSQAPALAQVERWLDTHLPEAIRSETHDTADSVRQIVEEADPNQFAIASEQAAKIYDGTIIASDITDEGDSYTRFILFENDERPNPDATATTLILQTDHSAGSLARALLVFGEHDINLSRIDSYPIVGDQQHYSFYVDADAPIASVAMQAVMQELAEQQCKVRVLGSYNRIS